MAHKVALPAFLITLAAASAGATATPGGGGASEAAGAAATPQRAGEAAKRSPVRYEAHDLFIETNATAGDAGLQMNLDGEDWNSLEVRDPQGRVLVDVTARSRLREFGLTELFFEASEPPFKEFPFGKFKKRFPEGRYTFRGHTVEGRDLAGSDRLSHLVPRGPNVTFPTEGALVDPNGLKVTWEPVTRPAGVRIASYQVIVIQGKRELSMFLPPRVTSVTIPAEFLRPGTETEGEVLAREKSGNQTITELPSFRTR
jgi:hypothetical protein